LASCIPNKKAGANPMFSMTQLVRRAAQTNGNAAATVDGDRRQSWQDYETKIAKFAGGLHKLGLGSGDCAAILALNSDRYFEFMFAVPWAGGVFQPVNTRLAGPEVCYWLTDSAAKVVFVDSSFVPLIESIRSEISHVDHFVFIDDGKVPEGYVSYAELISVEPVADAGRTDDEVAGLFYTGGTTGRSKGVMLSHKNLVVNAMQAFSVFEMAPNDNVLHVAPMFHIADAFVCLMTAATAGSNYFQPAFDPVNTMKGVQEHSIDRMLLVPTMINMFVNHPEVNNYDLSSLRHVLYGASPMPEPVIKKAMEILPTTQFYQAYGQTEAAPCITLLTAERHTFEGELAGKIKSAGQAIVGIDLAIMDGNGKPVETGMVGEVCIQGPNVMLGYRNMEEQTNEAIVDGWLHTGDGGYLDEEGFLFIVDRVKDMIVSGGENVYSAEVENAIYQHDAVSQCAVIGIPSEKWGEQVHAIIVPKENMSVSEEALISHCKTLIAGFKCPRSVTYQSQPLPLSGAGKILKTELRKPFWKDGDRNVN
jgi:long-chain acyl-CoA synthetase